MKQTLKFLREFHRVPKNKKVCWGIIEEITADSTNYRLGMIVEGTNIYLDVAQGRFFSQLSMKKLKRRIFPAVRSRENNCYVFTTEQGLRLEISGTYIADAYYPREYSKELAEDFLL